MNGPAGIINLAPYLLCWRMPSHPTSMALCLCFVRSDSCLQCAATLLDLAQNPHILVNTAL